MAFSLDGVRAGEQEDIRTRRRIAGVRQKEGARPKDGTQLDSSASEPGPPADLVGLSLSGGGVRAACLGLGLVQSLYKNGALKFFDYLSTVSGGGYTGSYLSSLVLKQQKTIGEDFVLKPEPGNKQPPRILRFIYGGQYLYKPWVFANKYLVGVFFNNVAFISGLVAICALIAFLWRCFDYRQVRDFLELLGLNQDWYAPFWPFLIFLVGWIIAWSVSYWRSGAEAPGRWAGYLLYLMVGSLLIGFALLLGNGDTGLGILEIWLGKATIEGGGYGKALFMLLLTALLPFLSPARLLQSGIEPRKPWEAWVFRVASTALVIGVPMFLIGALAKENISGYATHRDPKLNLEDVSDWHAFNETIHRYATEHYDREKKSEPGDDKTETERRNEKLSALAHLVSLTSGPHRSKADEISGRSTIGPDWISDETVLTTFRRQVGVLEKRAKGGIGPEDPLWKEIEASSLPDALFKEAKYLSDFKQADSTRNHSDWLLWNEPRRPQRAYVILGWLFGQSNSLTRYWEQKQAVRELKKEVCELVNSHLLTSEHLYDLAPRPWESSASAVPPKFPGESSTDPKQLEALLQRLRAGRTEAGGKIGTLAAGNLKNWDRRDLQRLNHRLLQAAHPTFFYTPGIVQRRIVIEEDQKRRLEWFGLAALAFVSLGLWVDVNSTSLHRFYRNRVAFAFIEPQNGAKRDLALSDLRTTDYGAPYHLINASVSLVQKGIDSSIEDAAPALEEEAARDLRSLDTFLFSRRYCGSDITGYQETARYEKYLKDNISLADATALSGSAVSPGRIENWLLALLMLVLNMRLGQWLPNPAAGRPRFRARVISLLSSFLRRPLHRPYCFISDGGFSENLGLKPLLQRRCRLIVALDASCDPKHQFKDFARVMRIARIHAGVRIVGLISRDGKTADPTSHEVDEPELAMTPLKLDAATGRCEAHLLAARLIYPETDEQGRHEQGLLIYLKPSLTGDEGIDLEQYRTESKIFPHHSSSDLLYDETQVECYRQLGFHLGEELCAALRGTTEQIDAESAVDLEKVEERLLEIMKPRASTEEQALEREKALHAAHCKAADALERIASGEENLEHSLRSLEKILSDVAQSLQAQAGMREALQSFLEHFEDSLAANASDEPLRSLEPHLKAINDTLSQLAVMPREAVTAIQVEDIPQFMTEMLNRVNLPTTRRSGKKANGGPSGTSNAPR